MLARALACLLLSATCVYAQGYPARPLRLIVPNPPGGATDTLARMLAPKLAERLGQPVLVDNRPGSNGNIATEAAARAAADGHTLLLAADAQIAISPHVYRMPVDPMRELVPVAAVATTYMVLAANAQFAPRTLHELVELAKKANPPIAYASIGTGSQHHVFMEMLRMRAGIEMVHVPFKGGGPAAIAVIAGEIPIMFGGNSAAPHIKSGKLRALAIASEKRSSAWPDVPTIAETYPGLVATPWVGLFVPIGTAAAIIARIHAETNAALTDSEVLGRFRAAGGMDPLALSTEAFAALVREDHAKYGQVVKAGGIRIDY